MKKYILHLTAVILVLLYVFSFSPSLKGQKVLKATETAFLNKKYADSVSELSVFKDGTRLSVMNRDGIWTGTLFSADGQQYDFPAETEIVHKTIERLQKTVKLYKISDGKKDLSSFSLDPSAATVVSYRTKDGISAEITVGKQDFSKIYSYIQLKESGTVYKTSFDFGELLHTETRFWYDPYIIPRIFFSDRDSGSGIQKIRILYDGKKNIYVPKNTENDYKLLQLRHGALAAMTGSTEKGQKSVLSLYIEFMHGSSLKMDFYKNREDYIIIYSSEIINCSFYVSGWTYMKILETLSLK